MLQKAALINFTITAYWVLWTKHPIGSDSPGNWHFMSFKQGGLWVKQTTHSCPHGGLSVIYIEPWSSLDANRGRRSSLYVSVRLSVCLPRWMWYLILAVNALCKFFGWPGTDRDTARETSGQADNLPSTMGSLLSHEWEAETMSTSLVLITILTHQMTQTGSC